MSHSHVGAPDALGWLLPVLVVAVPGTAYLWSALRRSRPWRRWRAAAFLTGLVLVGTALAPPLASLAHTDARAHMAQHLLLGMYAPLGLVLGAPVTLMLGALPNRGRRAASAVLRSPVVHVLAHPLAAALLSTGVLFLLYLWP